MFASGAILITARVRQAEIRDQARAPMRHGLDVVDVEQEDRNRLPADLADTLIPRVDRVPRGLVYFLASRRRPFP